MKIRYKLQVNEVAGQYIAVAVGEDAKKYKNITFLNKVGKYIIDLLQKEMTPDEVVAAVQAHYEGSESMIRNETLSFLDKLAELDLLSNEQGT